MLFSEYVRILQKHYKSTIGDAALCGTLFDFVIIPADLRNSKDPSSHITITPGTISKILSNTAPIHTKIRDHIYDDRVIRGLIKEFNDNIVPELRPEIVDLCFQMMEIIKSENISPSQIAHFEMLAAPETIAHFLAEVFIHAIATNSSNEKISSTQSIQQGDLLLEKSSLSIKGITNNLRLSDIAIEESFLSRIDISREKLLNRIKTMFSDAAAIHFEKKEFSSDTQEVELSLFKPYSLNEKNKDILNNVARSLKIELPEDFYDFGDLYINPLGGVNSLGLPCSSEEGSPLAKQKYGLVNQIQECISEFTKAFPFLKAFDETKCLSLALSNIGTNYDQDVRITLYFNEDSLLLPKEIACFDENALKYLVTDCDYESLFVIRRGIDYLSYEESKSINPPTIKTTINSYPFLTQQYDINYEEEIKDLLGYFYAKDNSGYIVEVTIDNINQHTAVAFPTIILIKDTIKEIPYTIKSKHQPHIISGNISIQNTTSNTQSDD